MTVPSTLNCSKYLEYCPNCLEAMSGVLQHSRALEYAPVSYSLMAFLPDATCSDSAGS